METQKLSSMDITVTQQGDNLFVVSGGDAPKLYDKMRQLAPEACCLEAGEMKDGAFTLRKIPAAPAQTAAH